MVVLTPGLTITNTAGGATTTPGATVSYTVTIANTGQTPYTGATVADDLTGVLDDAAYNGERGGDGRVGVVRQPGPDLDGQP